MIDFNYIYFDVDEKKCDQIAMLYCQLNESKTVTIENVQRRKEKQKQSEQKKKMIGKSNSIATNKQ